MNKRTIGVIAAISFALVILEAGGGAYSKTGLVGMIGGFIGIFFFAMIMYMIYDYAQSKRSKPKQVVSAVVNQ